MFAQLFCLLFFAATLSAMENEGAIPLLQRSSQAPNYSITMTDGQENEKVEEELFWVYGRPGTIMEHVTYAQDTYLLHPTTEWLCCNEPKHESGFGGARLYTLNQDQNGMQFIPTRQVYQITPEEIQNVKKGFYMLTSHATPKDIFFGSLIVSSQPFDKAKALAAFKKIHARELPVENNTDHYSRAIQLAEKVKRREEFRQNASFKTRLLLACCGPDAIQLCKLCQ